MERVRARRSVHFLLLSQPLAFMFVKSLAAPISRALWSMILERIQGLSTHSLKHGLGITSNLF